MELKDVRIRFFFKNLSEDWIGYKYPQKAIRNAEQDEDVTLKEQDEDATVVVPCDITLWFFFIVVLIGLRAKIK
jgi:hypothetical protein